MKRPVAVAVAALAFAVAPGPALADAAFNDHDCAGAVVSSAAAPGFGEGVAGAAQLQLVDNFGLADCGQTNRNNP